MSYFQRQRLESLFDNHKIDVWDMRVRMTPVLPRSLGVDLDTKDDPTITPDVLKKAILDGGSLAYNTLKHALKGNPKCDLKPCLDMLRTLTHEVKELYRWVWIWSEKSERDGRIMNKGNSWFVDIESAVNDGKAHRPESYTIDGPGAPHINLAIESVCPCNVHTPLGLQVIKPCRCYQPEQKSIQQQQQQQKPIPTPPPAQSQIPLQQATRKRPFSAESQATPSFSQQAPSEDSGILLEDGYLLLIDSLTIHKSTVAPSHEEEEGPPQYRYVILETGKVFYSVHPHILDAYREEKNKFNKYKSPPFKKARK